MTAGPGRGPVAPGDGVAAGVEAHHPLLPQGTVEGQVVPLAATPRLNTRRFLPNHNPLSPPPPRSTQLQALYVLLGKPQLGPHVRHYSLKVLDTLSKEGFLLDFSLGNHQAPVCPD